MALFVRDSGSATAPTIVFLHGGGTSGWSWRPVVERLADYHCLVPDLPEHGQSATEAPFTIPSAAAAVVDLLRRRAHGGRAHLVGLSLGAQVAVQLLQTAPDLLDRVMVSGTLVRRVPGAWLVIPLAKCYMPFRNNSLLVRANMRNLGVPPQYLTEFQEDTRLLTATAFTHIMKANLSFHISPGLDRVTTPTLITVGGREASVMRQSARDLCALLPKAQCYRVKGQGHNWSLGAPDLFSQTIRAWLSNQALPPALEPIPK